MESKIDLHSAFSSSSSPRGSQETYFFSSPTSPKTHKDTHSPCADRAHLKNYTCLLIILIMLIHRPVKSPYEWQSVSSCQQGINSTLLYFAMRWLKIWFHDCFKLMQACATSALVLSITWPPLLALFLVLAPQPGPSGSALEGRNQWSSWWRSCTVTAAVSKCEMP